MSINDKLRELIVGKESDAPFIEAQLPKTRKRQFLDILKHRYSAMIILSLLTFVFVAPALVWFIVFNAFINTVPPEMSGNEALLLERSFSLNVILYLFMIPLIIIAFIGLGGTFKVVKKLCWNEGIFLFSDFIKGVKDNFKVSLLSGLMLGMMLFITMSSIYFYNLVDVNRIIEISFITILIICLIIVISASLFMMTQAQIYKNSIEGYLKNSFLFSSVLLPQNLLVLLISVVPMLIYLIVQIAFVQLVWLIVLALIGFSILALVWYLYSIYIFDKFINRRYQKDIDQKGLYKEEK